jgi:hypothetical protein
MGTDRSLQKRILITQIHALTRGDGHVANHVEHTVTAILGSTSIKFASSRRDAMRQRVSHCRSDRGRVGVVGADFNVGDDRATLAHRVESGCARCIERGVGVNLTVYPVLIEACRFSDAADFCVNGRAGLSGGFGGGGLRHSR